MPYLGGPETALVAKSGVACTRLPSFKNTVPCTLLQHALQKQSRISGNVEVGQLVGWLVSYVIFREISVS